MPKLDGTGPGGQGPRTGRGLGNCFSNIAEKGKENNSKKFTSRKLDGTGPRGQGPRTGRGLGNCPKL